MCSLAAPGQKPKLTTHKFPTCERRLDAGQRPSLYLHTRQKARRMPAENRRLTASPASAILPDAPLDSLSFSYALRWIDRFIRCK
jgi:hypothetical protein